MLGLGLGLTSLRVLGRGGGAAATQAVLEYIDSFVITTDTNVYSFDDISFGEAAANRQILVCIGSRSNTAGTQTITAVTIGGVDAIATVEQEDGGASDRIRVGKANATVPTGTTGGIAITFSGNMVACSIAVYRVIGNIGTAVFDDVNALSANVEVPVLGAAVGYGFSAEQTTPRTATWVGITEDADEAVEGNFTQSSASDLLPDGGAIAMSCTWSGTPSLGTVGVFVPIGPS